MDNKEIRIGNLIKRNGILVTVDEQTFWDMKSNPDQYEPIMINEYWLKRFGFKEDPDGVYRRGGRELIEVFFFSAGFVVSSQSIALPDVDFIHQLQNLYFALTGNEIKNG